MVQGIRVSSNLKREINFIVKMSRLYVGDADDPFDPVPYRWKITIYVGLFIYTTMYMAWVVRTFYST